MRPLGLFLFLLGERSGRTYLDLRQNKRASEVLMIRNDNIASEALGRRDTIQLFTAALSLTTVSNIARGSDEILADTSMSSRNAMETRTNEIINSNIPLDFKTVRSETSGGDAEFELAVPVGWFVSGLKSRGIGGTPLPGQLGNAPGKVNGGGGSGSSKGKVNGALLSASDFASGLSVSVVESSLGLLLASQAALGLVEDGKLSPSALWDPTQPNGGRKRNNERVASASPIGSFQDSGADANAVAELLVRLRDGDLTTSQRLGTTLATKAIFVDAETAPALSTTMLPSYSSRASKELRFEASTQLSQGVSGSAGFSKCLTASTVSQIGEERGIANATFAESKKCDRAGTVTSLRESAARNAVEQRRFSRARAILLPPTRAAMLSGVETDNQAGRLLVLYVTRNGEFWNDAVDGVNRESHSHNAQLVSLESQILDHISSSFAVSSLR